MGACGGTASTAPVSELVPARRDIRTPPALEILPGCPNEGGISAVTEWLHKEIAKCRASTTAEAKVSCAELYDRPWRPPSSDLDDGAAAGRRFVVMQFNILAEGLAASAFGHVPARAACQPWERRRWRLVEEVLRCSPDLLAMEELDHYADFFEPVLGALGYKGFWVAKPHSPCLDFGFFSDGTAIFWRCEAFEALAPSHEGHYRSVSGGESNQVFVYCDLRHRATGEVVRFVATHLKAGISSKEEGVRAAQVPQLLQAISLDSPAHAIICGDFNSVPTNTWTFTGRAVRGMLADDRLRLKNAYPLGLGDGQGNAPEPLEFTLFTKKWGWDVKLVLDYIFHTDGLRPTAWLELPRPEDMEASRLPGLRYPSDHFAIAAEFQLQ